MQAAKLYRVTPEIKSTVELNVPIDLLQLIYFYLFLPASLYHIKSYCVQVKAFARLFHIKLIQIYIKLIEKRNFMLSILLSFLRRLIRK